MSWHYLDNFEHLNILDIAAAPGPRLVLVAQLLEALLLTNERLVLSELTNQSTTHLTLLHLDHLHLHQAASRPSHKRHVKILVLRLDQQHLGYEWNKYISLSAT